MKKPKVTGGTIASPGGLFQRFGEPAGEPPFATLRRNQDVSGIVGETARRTMALYQPSGSDTPKAVKKRKG